MAKSQEIKGSSSFTFGNFEWLKTINWMTLLWSIAAAVVAFVMTDVVPALQALGGVTTTIVASVVVPILIALKQWISDNTSKSIKVEK